MPTVNGVKHYSSVSVLQIVLGDHPSAENNQKALGVMWLDYGYAVRNTNQTTLGLVSNDLHASDEAASRWFTQWLNCEEAAQERADDMDKLLIICYFGHGSVLESSTMNGWQDDHLVVSSPCRRFQFDMTEIQQITRDSSKFDVLFVLECCYASQSGMETEVDPEDSPPSFRSLSYKTQERICA